MRWLVGALGVLVAGPLPAMAPGSQVPVPPAQAPASQGPGAELTVYLMTMGHGDQVWERFGHNAIRIVDASRGTDSVYNWGTFDFDQPNFLGRFLTGNTLYWMQGDDLAGTMELYRYLNRSVWVQELDLTARERAAVRDFIAWNARPENRYYRYDYYNDNCSTRVRDLIDRIVGGQLRTVTAGRLTPTTYRFHTQRLLQFDRAVALGTNIGLGGVADRPISPWEEMFLPTRMQEHLRTVSVTDSAGTPRPLVRSEQQLFAASRPAEPATVPGYLLRNLLVAAALGALLVVLGARARGGSRGARLGLASVGSLWAGLNGVLAILLIVGWTATRHVFMARNENLLQFHPLSLVLAVVLPLALFRGRGVNLARALAALGAAVALVGLAIQALPGLDQVNGEVIALTLPVHLALAWAIRVSVPAPDEVALRVPVPGSGVARHSAS